MDNAHLLMREGPTTGAPKWDPPIDELFMVHLGLGKATDKEISSIPSSQSFLLGRLINGRVPDVLGSLLGPFIIAPAIKEFLKENEPGVHRFLPVEIKTEDTINGRLQHGNHWLLVPPPKIDCLNLEKTVMTYDIQDKPWVREKCDSDYWGGGYHRAMTSHAFLNETRLRGGISGELWRASPQSTMPVPIVFGGFSRRAK